MNEAAIVGRRVRRVGGVVEGLAPGTGRVRYLAVLGLDDGSVVLLGVCGLERLAAWPDDATDLPVEALSGSGRLGDAPIVGAFLTVRNDRDAGVTGERQLFLLTADGRFFGLVPVAGGGTELHVEDLASAPMLRGGTPMCSLSGERLGIDDLSRLVGRR